MRRFLFVSLLLFASFLYSKSQATSWSHWINKEKDIDLDYPSNWKISNYVSGDIITFLSPESGNSKNIPEMITFRSIINADNYTLTDLKSYIVQNVIKSENGLLQSSEDIFKGNIQANVSIASVKFNRIDYVAKLYAFIKNDEIYLLILISLKNNFEQNSPIIDKVFDSLEVKDLP